MRSFGLKILLVAAVFLLPQTAPSRAQAPRSADAPALTVLVRHADRASADADSPLSAAGKKRADDLAAALRDTKFSAIIVTDYIRTRDTAGPIAMALGMVAESVKRKDEPAARHVEMINAAVRRNVGGVVLVVNHSDTLPAIIAALGGPRIGGVCESIYDDLFMLVPASANMQFVHSRYGAPTPPGPECASMQSGPAR